MYPIERAMKVFKGYICNKVRLKTSMAEAYIYDETIRFVNEYMVEFKHVRTRVWDANEKGVCGEILEGTGTRFNLDSEVKDLAHQYVLTNVACVALWVQCIIMEPLSLGLHGNLVMLLKAISLGNIK
jgi:hypothetical protein